MKKVIISTIVQLSMLTIAANAEMKFGVGADIVNYGSPGFSATPLIRIPVDFDESMRVELRIGYKSQTSAAVPAVVNTQTSYGLGGYYNFTDTIGIGAFYDAKDDLTDNVSNFKASATGLVLKGETEIGTNFTFSSEVGYVMTSKTNAGAATSSSTMEPLISATLRYFF